MNRLNHLKKTILKNIIDNLNYPELEFILLDYNSNDGMGDWVRENLHSYILNSKLIYYRTNEPKEFSHSHSKNLAFKLANGEIVCNINADHFTGINFANYVNEQFNQNTNIVITPIDFFKTKEGYNPPGDIQGKVGVKKNDFLTIKGFNEKMHNYGWEDYDFVNRLEMIGLKRVFIEDNIFMQFISHGTEERYSVEKYFNKVYKVYVNYLTPSISEILILYKDQNFDIGTIEDNSTINSEDYTYAYIKRSFLNEYTIHEPGWTKGQWKKSARSKEIVLFLPDGTNTLLSRKSENSNDDILYDKERATSLFKVIKSAAIQDFLSFKYFYSNKALMESNLQRNHFIGNEADFGKATVFKNFNTDKAIHI